MANFFVDRPVFAWVIALITMLAGVIALRTLPLEQYPDIAPPTIWVTSTYPGASAKAVEDSVTQVIEQQLTGLDGLDYITSNSSSSGLSTVTLTFRTGTNPDVAQVQVQNKVSLATPLLPETVQRQGVLVNKASAGFLLVSALTSDNEDQSQIDLADLVRNIYFDPISRIDGVGDVRMFGSPYAMRIWLDADKLTQYELVPSDIVSVISAQNTQVSSGSLGGSPAIPGQQITATITLQSLLSTPEEFSNLPIRTSEGGQTIRLGDVARVEMGAETYSFIARYNGKPAAPFAISMSSGANALATADAIKEKLHELAPQLPAGVEPVIPYDSTPFIEASLHEVEKTLYEAVFLVFVVVLIFLQNFRSVIIPMIAVPVVLLGTLAVFALLGYTINTLTMFALVLAIGLLVDDAIVVVENVERVMEEDELGPREATRKSMGQITGALVGIAVVLSAVFVPMAFFPGSTGVIYRQFSVTIVAAMVLSVLVAIILSPALCATILKAPHEEGRRPLLARPGKVFNRFFNHVRGGYESIVARLIGIKWIMMGAFVAIVAVIGFGFVRLPTSFLPDEDQGAVMTLVQLPVGASLERTATVMEDLQHYYRDNEDAIKHVMTISGYSYAGQGQNMAVAFVRLMDWEERPGVTAQAIAGRAFRAFMGNPDAQIYPITPAPIPALGNSSGFNLYIQDQGGLGHDALLQARNQLLGMAAQSDLLSGVRPNGQEDSPQFKINIDYQKAQALGVSSSDITSLMSIGIGGRYVNDFIDRGRIKKVYVQGDAKYRMQEEDFGAWQVRNASGEMTPIEEFITTEWIYGAPQLERYNGLSAFNIQGQPAPGVSSGAAMNEMERLIAQLPEGVASEWSGISAQERESGDQSTILYILSVMVVFLCLAALYESWTVPISVLLVAPLGVGGALAFAMMRGLSNDVFFQVGLLTTIGLASKNAILIVEFAKLLEEQGKELVEATLEAARMRFRPIIMTSFAFGLGVVPLAFSSGAGAGARVAIGSAVLGGMIASTVLGVLFAPIFYIVVRKLTGAKSLVPANTAEEAHA
ncbi:MAG: hydrophobe/amphiphile efflux-1 family RND transporter [Hirschia sp.]|nr:hydrophobe/amphiphile efflux-1 family RND transporter [Hirschia sp.]MBF19032.1 hydrophobe/amphiphile efflux-1 family RND transporter [Hirschia sp.]